MVSMPLDTGGSPAGAMKLVRGDPSLDFVNTVGGRVPGHREESTEKARRAHRARRASKRGSRS